MLHIVVSRWGQAMGVSDHEVGLVRIGSAADNDLQIEHDDLSPHHVEVFVVQKQPYVRSPDGRPLRVDGKRVDGQAPVRDGQSVQVGEFSFQLTLLAADARAVADARTCRTGRAKLEGTHLVPLPGLDEEERLLLEARRILVGRGAPQAQLDRLRERGPDLAREIVEHHAHQGLEGVAVQVRGASRRELTSEATPPTASLIQGLSPRLGPAAMLVAALVVAALLAWRVYDLMLSMVE